MLAQGKGRVVIASSRPDELSWVLPGMRNSLFTHYILEVLRGEGKRLGMGLSASSMCSAMSPAMCPAKPTSIRSLKRRRWKTISRLR